MRLSKKNIYQYLSQSLKIVDAVRERGFFHLFSANFFINLVGFGSQFLVAWLLSPKELGEVKIMQSFIMIASILTSLGFNNSTLKLCSENRNKGEKIFLLKKAIDYSVVCLAVIFPIFLTLIFFGLISRDSDLINYFYLFSFSLIPITFMGIFSSYLTAIKQFRLLSKVQIWTKILSIILIILLTYYNGIYGYIFSINLGYLLTMFILKKEITKLNSSIQPERILNPFRQHIHYARTSFVTNVVTQIALMTDVFVMNYKIQDKNEIGFYSLVLTIISGANIFTTTVQQMAAPHLSEMAFNKLELKKVARKYGRINVMVSFCIAGAMVLIMPFCINFFFGGKYNNAIPYLFALTAAWFFQNVVTFEGYVLWAAGKVVDNFYTYLIVLILGFIISSLLVGSSGLIGLAYAKAITYFIAIFIVKFIYRRGMRFKQL